MKKPSDEVKIFVGVLLICIALFGVLYFKHLLDTDWGKHPSNDQVDIFR